MHNFVVLTEDQVLHDGDVVSRSGEFGNNSYHDSCSSYHQHHFWMSGSRLILDHSFCGNSFIELQDFSSRSVVMTTLISFVIFPL